LQRELNVPTLLPYLNKYRLITADVYEKLTLQSTNATKVEKLVAELPKSGEDFLERFIKCLRHSAKEEPGTCHEQIADILEEEAKCQNSQGKNNCLIIVVNAGLFCTATVLTSVQAEVVTTVLHCIRDLPRTEREVSFSSQVVS